MHEYATANILEKILLNPPLQKGEEVGMPRLMRCYPWTSVLIFHRDLVDFPYSDLRFVISQFG